MSNDITDKLPEELRAIYCHAHKASVVVEQLKVVAALKLWVGRGYREVGFGVPCDFAEKRSMLMLWRGMMRCGWGGVRFAS